MIKKKLWKKILKICYLKDNFNPSRKPSSMCEFHLNASWRTTYRLHMYFPSSQKLTYTSKLKLQKWFLFSTTHQHECLQATTILPLKSKLSLAFEGHQSRVGESRGTSRMVLGCFVVWGNWPQSLTNAKQTLYQLSYYVHSPEKS